MELTQANYYDKENEISYMSFSRFKNFLSNPARALADLKGEYDWFSDNKALLIGNFLHSYFESPEAHQKFISENESEIISSRGASKGHLKTDYKVAEKMIQRLEKEKQFNFLMNGTQREVIVTGEIGGRIWKGKIDALNLDKNVFIDFKTVRTLVDDASVWDSEKHERVNFIIQRRYDMQMAIYQELLRQTYGEIFTPVIWAVSKENEPLAKAYELLQPTLDEALEEVIYKIDEVAGYIDETVESPLIDDGSNYYNFAHRVTADDYVGI